MTFLFQLLAVSESLAYGLTQLDIGMMNRIERDQIHLLHIGFAVFCQVLFITEDIDDFCNEIIACLAFVYLLLNPTFKVPRFENN